MKRICVWALAGLLLAACGDDEKKSKDATQQCKDLINAFCDRVTSCAVAADILDDEYPAADVKADCQENGRDELNCETADAISEGYDDCLSDAKTAGCAASNAALIDGREPLAPTSCQGVILYDP